MARPVKISVIGATAPKDLRCLPSAAQVDGMIGFWRRKFERVLPDKPDLIVVPEWCDDCSDHASVERFAEFSAARGDRVLDAFREVARTHRTFLTYPSLRQGEDGGWHNSVRLIDRRGEIVGTYDKWFPTIIEIEGGIRPGRKIEGFDTEIGRIAIAICYDLNFDEVRRQVAAQKPELILFSSMYHGGLMEPYWAYSCRAYFAGACDSLPSQIYSPVGQLVATTSSHFDWVTATVNLDYRLVHLDYHREKLAALKAKYGERVSICDPSYLGSVLVTSEHPTVGAAQMLEELEIEETDRYFDRSRAVREAAAAR